MLKVENLYKNFGNIAAVAGISFEVKRGEVFGLLGPNGAGKSTTISIISTLLPPSRGQIFFEGESIFENSRNLRQKLGIVPQDIALYPTLTGYENLRFWGNLYGLKGAELKKRINEVAEIIGLKERLKDKVEKYSGGMKRRLNIGAALLHKPDLLIMDEPTVGIDPQSRSHILETVLKLNAQGMTIIYTTHYMEEAEELCSRICIMDEGKIIASGTKQELVELVKERTRINIKLDNISDNMPQVFKEITGVLDAAILDDTVTLFGENGDILLAEIISKVLEEKSKIQSIDIHKPDLEAVFLHLTGKALRD
ncbi:MAG TPA: ABC transporter ATP-binding protein [Sedimentibacter sp.]|jgi:ABC-2 type transport system ATP-binding protein|nr:ABC transporter ATP-binding protein [Sedimentibacter sp.]HHZ00067.1 ABC transporter ATP-binding protein [Tissierellia bacterium]HOK49973.1 ABC transporter ATP-binding protein [Sedimentibacter sp.]HOW22954.1 ABC transporter ATP-binding protein [Sedimentibacter sp.]HRC80009.1 ABC transporter ATP-binding protein [Sedimentibacter sp.]